MLKSKWLKVRYFKLAKISPTTNQVHRVSDLILMGVSCPTPEYYKGTRPWERGSMSKI